MRKPITVLLSLFVLITVSLSGCSQMGEQNSTASPSEDIEPLDVQIPMSDPTLTDAPMPTQTMDSQYTITVERIDKSIFSDNGIMLAEIWFELPVLSGDSKGVVKINAFYEQWCDEWLNGDDAKAILETLDTIIKTKGEEYFLTPERLTHIISSTVYLLDNDTLSIAHTSGWYGGGSPSHSLYGETFDIEKGTLIECPYDISNLAFRDDLESLSPNVSLFDNTGGYFRDAEHIYIITREYRGDVLKWNGKTGEGFKAEVLDILP